MITASVQPFGKFDLAEQLAALRATSETFAAGAELILAKVDAANRSTVGVDLPKATLVDGVETDDLDRVRPGGTIVRSYDLLPVVLTEVGRALWEHSPVLTGRYQHSHRLILDDAEFAVVNAAGWVAPALPKGVRKAVFASSTYYDVLIEPHDGQPGQSRQAPDGVYHVIALLAGSLFAGLVKCAFDYRDVAGSDEPEPSIVIERIG